MNMKGLNFVSTGMQPFVIARSRKFGVVKPEQTRTKLTKGLDKGENKVYISGRHQEEREQNVRHHNQASKTDGRESICSVDDDNFKPCRA